jgi:Mg2+/citrate symporter
MIHGQSLRPWTAATNRAASALQFEQARVFIGVYSVRSFH